MKLYRIVFTVLSLAYCASGCALETQSGSDQAVPPAGTANAAEVEAWMSEHGAFVEPQAPTNEKGVGWWQTILKDEMSNLNFGATDRHMCVLNEVAGEIASGPGLRFDSFFQLWGLRQGAGQKTRATCVPFSSFRMDSGGVAWRSDSFGVEGHNGITRTATWWGNAATVINSVSSTFDGDGESVRIVQSSDGKSSSFLEATNNKVFLETKGSARSFFLGVQGTDKLTSLIGYKDGALKRGNIKSSGTFTFDVSTVSGYSSFWMADVEAAICYFSRVQGQFDSLEDQLVIYKNGDQWYLRARSTSSRGISGAARCMAYDQR